MPLDLTDDKSTLVQVLAWCRQATSHYLSQCWPRFMSPNGITRPQWVNLVQSLQHIWGLSTHGPLARLYKTYIKQLSYNACWNHYSKGFHWQQRHNRTFMAFLAQAKHVMCWIWKVIHGWNLQMSYFYLMIDKSTDLVGNLMPIRVTSAIHV